MPNIPQPKWYDSIGVAILLVLGILWPGWAVVLLIGLLVLIVSLFS